MPTASFHVRNSLHLESVRSLGAVLDDVRFVCSGQRYASIVGVFYWVSRLRGTAALQGPQLHVRPPSKLTGLIHPSVLPFPPPLPSSRCRNRFSEAAGQPRPDSRICREPIDKKRCQKQFKRQCGSIRNASRRIRQICPDQRQQLKKQKET
jgi:hypothetical protein